MNLKAGNDFIASSANSQSIFTEFQNFTELHIDHRARIKNKLVMRFCLKSQLLRTSEFEVSLNCLKPRLKAVPANS